MKDESRPPFIPHPSSLILSKFGAAMREDTVTKIPDLKERLTSVRSYL